MTFKCRADLCKLDPDDPAYPVMDECIKLFVDDYNTIESPYIPELYGYQVLIEESDIDKVIDLPEVACKLVDVRWESAYMREGYFYAIYLASDQLGLGFLIPDAPWLNGELRTLLEDLVAEI